MALGRLTRKAATLGLGRVSAVLARFGLSILLVRWWTPELYGQFHQIRVMIEVAALLDLGLPMGLLQAAAGKKGHERDDVFRRGAALALVAGALAGLILAAYGLISGGPLAAALPVAGIMIAATIPSSALESALVVKDRHLQASLIGGLSGLAGFGLGALVLFVHPTLLGVYSGLALSALARLVALWWSGRLRRLVVPWSVQTWSLLRLSIQVSGNRLLSMLSAQVDRIVIGLSFSAGTLGHYVNGAWEVPFMGIFFGAITAAMLPDMSEHWARGRPGDMHAIWKGAAERAAWIVFPLFLWAWIWGPEILRVLFTQEYVDALPVFRLYLLMLPLRIAIYSALLIAMDEVRLLVWGALLDVVVNAALSIALAHTVGWLGPAAATAAGTYAQVVFYAYHSVDRLGTRFSRFLPWRRLLLAAMSAAVAVVPTLLFRRYVEGDVPLLILSAAFAGVVNGGLVLRICGREFLGFPRKRDV